MKTAHWIFLTGYLLLSKDLMAQDSLFFKNKVIEAVKLREISSSEVSYHKFDNQDGPVLKVEKEKLEKIRFENGLVEFISQPAKVPNENPDSKNNPSISFDPTSENCYRNVPIKTMTYWDGITDASRYYRGYKATGTGSFFSGMFLVYGLPVPLITSLTPPKNIQYFVPDKNLYALNPEYAAGFDKKAYRMKQTKAWANFGYGAGTVVGLSMVMFVLVLAAFAGN